MAEQKCCPDCLRALIGLDTEEIDGLLYCEMCAWDKKHPKAEIIYLGEDLAGDFDSKHYPIDDHMFEQFFVEDFDNLDLPQRSPEELGLTGVECTLSIGPEAGIYFETLPPAISWLARMRLKHYREYLARTDD